MEYQKFRFCCGCQRVTLVQEKGCYFCGSTFILDSLKPDAQLANMTKYNKEKAQKQKLKKLSNELLCNKKTSQRV